MTKRSLYGFLLGTALMALPLTASAQTVAELKPTGQWLVNNAGVQGLAKAGAAQTPCIMANQYNNGFILRMAGGAQQLMSLSLDFRQNAFSQGQTYPAMVSIDGGNAHNLTATAFSPGILIINVREARNLYAEIQAGRSLALNVVGNTIIFSLDRITEGFQRMESCYSPPSQSSQPAQVSTNTIKPIPTKPDTDVYVKREGYPEFKQPSAQDILKAGTDKPAPIGAPSEPVTNVATAAPLQTLPPLSKEEMADLDLKPEDLAPYEATPGMKVTSSASNKGETPRPPSVPKVAAQPVEPVTPIARSSVEQPMTPPSPLPLPVESPKPVAVAAVTPRASTMPRGPMASSGAPSQKWEAEAGEDMRQVLTRWAERADTDLVWDANNSGKVAQDISVSGTFEDAVAQVMADNAAALGIRGQFSEGDRMVPVVAQTANRAPTSITGGSQGALSAQSGDDLKLVLQTWASQNNVDLKWQSGDKFALSQPISGQGDFTSAIEAALTQFDDQAVRPVGQLNRDPNTGRLSLTIETDRAS